MTAVAPAPDSATSAASLIVFDPAQLYTVAQVVERTQLGRSSLYKAMKEGDLPYLRLGEARRILGGDANRFLAKFYHSSAR